jgi:hypothetical protein
MAQTTGRAIDSWIRYGAEAAGRARRARIQEQKHHDQRRRLEDATSAPVPPCGALDYHQTALNALKFFCMMVSL